MATRRTFLKYATIGVGVVGAGVGLPALAADNRPLIERVSAACRRLAPLGWQALLLDATGGELDLGAPDLKAELGKPLGAHRSELSGLRRLRCLGHAGDRTGSTRIAACSITRFAAPTVVADRKGTELGGFPTLAEIEARRKLRLWRRTPPSMDDAAQAASRRRPLGSRRLRPAIPQCADLGAWAPCRAVLRPVRHRPAGHARAALRCPGAQLQLAWTTARPFDFRVMPRRFAAYLAVQMPGEGTASGRRTPCRKTTSCNSGCRSTSCSAAPNASPASTSRLELDQRPPQRRAGPIPPLPRSRGTGEQLARRGSGAVSLHDQGRDDRLAVRERRTSARACSSRGRRRWSRRRNTRAALLTFPVDGRYTSDPANIQLSSMQVLPSVAPNRRTALHAGLRRRQTQRPSPQFINIRHRLLPERTDRQSQSAAGHGRDHPPGRLSGAALFRCGRRRLDRGELPAARGPRRRPEAGLLHGRAAGLLPQGNAAGTDALVAGQGAEAGTRGACGRSSRWRCRRRALPRTSRCPSVSASRTRPSPRSSPSRTDRAGAGADAERSLERREDRPARRLAGLVRPRLGHQPGNLLHRSESPLAEIPDRLTGWARPSSRTPSSAPRSAPIGRAWRRIRRGPSRRTRRSPAPSIPIRPSCR